MSKTDRKSQVEAEIERMQGEISKRNEQIADLAEQLQALQSYNRFDEDVIKLRKEELSKYK